MKNNTKSIITIEMKNVDHACKLTEALRVFFACSDMGGDCHLVFGNDDSRKTWTDCGFIGHDVRRPIISRS